MDPTCMKLLYEAANAVEAHMIVNLLEQSELTARIDGEFLQGGVGELQAFGVVRVMIDDTDYDQAIEIIKLWESKTAQSDEIMPTISIGSVKFQYFILGIVIGFVFGVAVSVFSR